MLGSNVVVEAGALVEDSVIMNNVTVKAGSTVRYSILDANVTVGENATVGEYRLTASEVAVVGADVVVPAGKKIAAGAMISEM